MLDKSDVKEIVKGLKSPGATCGGSWAGPFRCVIPRSCSCGGRLHRIPAPHILSMLRNPEVVKPANPANAHIELDGEE